MVVPRPACPAAPASREAPLPPGSRACALAVAALPLAAAAGGQVGRGLLASSLTQRAHNVAVKILVVDDERAVRESLRRALELEGYEIELADDGRRRSRSSTRTGPSRMR